MELTSKQRAHLKSLANGIDPIFQVGKSSLTPEFTASITDAFNTRELLKKIGRASCRERVLSHV